MKELTKIQNRLHNVSLVATTLLLGVTGCATKDKGQPYQITAAPIRSSEVAPMAKEIQRTSPGEIMDPDAQVFAQVPKRILYLPGESTLTGRTSPEQIAAYSLVNVNQIPEIQSNAPTTVVLTDPNQNPDQGQTDIVNLTISERGSTEEGTARILNVSENVDIDRARGRIRPGETLRFIDTTGWVGWIPKGASAPTRTQEIPEKLNNDPLPPLLTPEPTPAPTEPEPSPTPEEEIKLSPAQQQDSNLPPPLKPKTL